ncbi:MAG: hypothetical protein SFT92_06380 [Rickettsiales bacterium]|nr:hypothetical protein [Rickettsiales bacterium]
MKYSLILLTALAACASPEELDLARQEQATRSRYDSYYGPRIGTGIYYMHR